MLKLTTNQFIDKAIKLKNNLYSLDYSPTVYITAQDNVKIICIFHGLFEQKAAVHLRGSGCPSCANNKLSNITDFIDKANKIHFNFYDYSKAIYINAQTKLIIICPIHNEFTQKPKHHLNNVGCPHCANNQKSNTIAFLNKANNIHNFKFDYNKFIYINAHTPSIIICSQHGDFKQSPSNHLAGNSCPSCNNSILELKWLDSLNITNRQVKLPHLDNLKVDGYDPATNTVYEFYGDFWHGNPLTTDHNALNPKTKTTFKELFENTVKRENKIKNHYNLITIWESEFISFP